MRSSENGQCEFLVIGGGTAGLVGAKTAAGLGANVVLVERDRPGGDCLWTGCIPSKSLIAAASAAAQARRASSIGVHVDGVRVDFGEVMAHVHRAIRTIEPTDSFAALRASGIDVIAGDATFASHDTVRVGGELIRFRQALIATGAAPALPDIRGLSGVAALTSDNVWELAERPDRLVVVGGGPIGCELGQAFARLGSRVTIVTRGSRLLSREDPEAAECIRVAMATDGVDVMTGATVVRAESAGPAGAGAGTLWLEDGRDLPFDAVLVATGRAPRTPGLNLEAAGVATDARGRIVVDGHLRTANPNVWAAGDVTGVSHHTHTAGVHGSLAASNAVLGVRRTAGVAAVPCVTFTSPELAAVGASTDPAQTAPGSRLLTWHHAELDRAITGAETNGLTRLVVAGDGTIAGATVVGPRAGETLGELSVAVRRGLRPRDLVSVIHAYPTYNDAVWNVAIADLRHDHSTGATGHAIQLLHVLRRVWLRVRRPGAGRR